MLAMVGGVRALMLMERDGISSPARAASGLGDTNTSGLNRFRLGERAPPPALLIKILHVQA